MDLKGKEKLIGVVLGVVIAIAASVAGLQSDLVKEGFCGEPQASEVSASAVSDK